MPVTLIQFLGHAKLNVERIGVRRQPARIPCVSKAKIEPAKKIDGVVELPGDKSISHRYAILSALAEGASEIRNYSIRGRLPEHSRLS